MLDTSRFPGRIVATREIAPRTASLVDVPPACHPTLRAALEQQGIRRLYSHQAAAFAAAQAGRHVVVTTGTASGKSLAYLLPVMQSVLQDPTARTLLLFPTKALTQDQHRGLLRLIDDLAGACDGPAPCAMESGVYDGDTPPADRARIRDRANLILTNPDMLHAALLPSHGRRGFAHIFRHVRYIVIDELHTYRGAFGAHFANLMRRLARVCRHYGSHPQFLCSSATIANPREHAEALCHEPFELIDRDGSPSAGRLVYFWQPPLEESGMRRPVTSEMALLIPHLVTQRHRTIAFCRSRKETEIVLKESRDRLQRVAGHDEGDLLAGYRGGYTPEERRQVERGLLGGRLLGVVSTNALELGIDIGRLQVVVQGGLPGTRASFWQQLGRAGRRRERSEAIIILAVSPTDQFIAKDPDWLVGQPAEHAVVDRDNLAIQLAHVRAAAAELPLTLDDAALFPDLGEIVGVLQRAQELREVLGAWHWTGDAFPAGDLSLRNIHNDRFKVVNRETGTTLTEMSRPQVYREAHTRAVYLHDGVQYQVESLDLVGHVATVVEVDQNFYTQPDVRSAIEVLLTQERRPVGVTRACFGDVRVDDEVVGYKMLEFHNHQNLGYEALHEHLRLELETEAVWLPIPEPVLVALGQEREDAVAGMVHAVTACARLLTMAERTDLVGTSFHDTDEESGETVTALICHDSYPGGLGYASKAYEQVATVVRNAVTLLEGCRCRCGCPACVGSYSRDRHLVAWAVRSLLEAQPRCRPAPGAAEGRRGAAGAAGATAPGAPGAVGATAPGAPGAVGAAARIPWEQVAQRWREVVARLRAAGIAGAELLATVGPVTCRGRRLVVEVASPALASWLAGESVARQLWPAITAAVAAPPGARLQVEVAGSAREQALRTAIKLRRRLDDLTGSRPATEREANDKLASGYVRAQDVAKPPVPQP